MNYTPYPSDRKQMQQAQQQQQRIMEQQRKASMYMAQQQSMPPPAMQQRRVHFADEMPTSAPMMRPVMPSATLTNTDIVGSSPRMAPDPLENKAEKASADAVIPLIPDVSAETEALVSALRLICVLALFATVYAIPQEYRVIWGIIVAFTIVVTTSSMMSRTLLENNETGLGFAVLKTGVAAFFFGVVVVVGFMIYKIYRLYRDRQKEKEMQMQQEMMSNMQQHSSSSAYMPPMMMSSSKKLKKKKGRKERPGALF